MKPISIETTVVGIPAIVNVTYYHHQKPNRRADNDYDYYGYEEMEYEVCDRRGRIAPWLAKKIDKNADEEIRQTIINYFEEE